MVSSVIVTVVLVGLILGGVRIFLALGAAGLLGLYLARGPIALCLAPTSFFGQLSSFELIALPLFILMGYVLAETPIGRHLFHAAERWLSWLRGGLAIASVGACTLFGAISGVGIAGVASVGALAVPEMVQRGYSRSLASGAVVTAGAIAMLMAAFWDAATWYDESSARHVNREVYPDKYRPAVEQAGVEPIEPSPSLQAYEYGERMSTPLGTPMALPYLLIPIGFGVLALRFAVNAAAALRGRPAL